MSDWTRRLEPVLRQQEESTAFDIYSYADSLLSKVSETVALPETARTRRSIGSFGGLDTGAALHDDEEPTSSQVVGIEEIAAGMDASEFSRMFLACLQLANSGNIEIIAPSQMTITPAIDAPVETPAVVDEVTSTSHFFGIQLLNANVNFGLQMNLSYSVEEETKPTKTKASGRSKAAPASSLTTMNKSQAIPTNE